jgi:hypothetical protein
MYNIQLLLIKSVLHVKLAGSLLILYNVSKCARNKKSSVSIAMGYRLDSRGSIPSKTKCFSSPHHPDWLWGPPSLSSNG